MEEQILEMLKNSTIGVDDGYGDIIHCIDSDFFVDLSKKITSHVMGFIEWKDKNVGLPNRNGVYLYWEDHLTINGLYDYWIKNVHD